MFDVLSEARAVHPRVIAWRRQFHRHPELSMQEFSTTAAIADALKKMGLEPRLLKPTGCIVEITGAHPGPTVALRADIDAIPVTEKSGVDFSSENPGVMHACGHDTHAAMLLGAAQILSRLKDRLYGTARLIFQPAEETGRGAEVVFSQGGLDQAQAAFAIHIVSQAPANNVYVKSGALFPAVGVFTVRVRGVGCHGATPDKGADATLAASAVVMNLQSIVSRELPPMSPAVVTVGKLNSGTGYNVLSGEAVMEGTVRIFDRKLHEQMPGIMERIANRTAEAYRCTAEVDYMFSNPALVTDEKVTQIARGAAVKILPKQQVITAFESAMGGEDFAAYTEHLPCSYVFLGGGGTYPMHSEHLVLDEQALLTGTALDVQFALDYLSAPAG